MANCSITAHFVAGSPTHRRDGVYGKCPIAHRFWVLVAGDVGRRASGQMDGLLSRRKMETSFAYGRNCVSSRLAKTGNNADDGFRYALLGLAARFLAIAPLLD